jgi:RND superfamily putative drug exporter
MALISSKIWYHPQWFSRYVPDPDIEGRKLERQLEAGELVTAGSPVTGPASPAPVA